MRSLFRFTMARKPAIALAFLMLFSTNALAGLGSSIYSSGYGGESGTAIAAVQIKDKGIYNLVITVPFFRKPQESKIYNSDEHGQRVDRLLVEAHGVASQKVPETQGAYTKSFSDLKKSIEADIDNLATEQKRNCYQPKKSMSCFQYRIFAVGTN